MLLIIILKVKEIVTTRNDIRAIKRPGEKRKTNQNMKITHMKLIAADIKAR